MANTSSRMLRLLALLETNRYWPGADLAARLEVSVRTLRRDIDRLRELGYPVRAHRGVEGGYQLAAGAALPPLVLDDEEAVALAIGLQAAAHGPVEGIAEASVRALAKVTQVMPGRLRHRVEALTSVTSPGQWGGAVTPRLVGSVALTEIALACRDSERLRFTYKPDRGGAPAIRHVEPHRLVSLGRRWYLVCYDLDRLDWRSFRLDRVSSPAGTGVRFRPRDLPGGDAVAFVRAGVDGGRQPYQVEAAVEAPAEVVRARIGQWCTVEPIDDGRCRITMAIDILDWAAMALGVAGAEFRVVSPPELASHVRDWSERFGRAASS